MEEMLPGVVKVSDYDFANNKIDGTERIIDYDLIGYSPEMIGPISIVKELRSHAEYKERAIAIAIIDSIEKKLEKVFWFQGTHIFPKEHLELAVNGKEIAIMFFNHGIKDKNIVDQLVEVMLPKSGSTYDVLDLLWIESDTTGSFMCIEQPWCCPPGGLDLSTLDES